KDTGTSREPQEAPPAPGFRRDALRDRRASSARETDGRAAIRLAHPGQDRSAIGVLERPIHEKPARTHPPSRRILRLGFRARAARPGASLLASGCARFAPRTGFGGATHGKP